MAPEYLLRDPVKKVGEGGRERGEGGRIREDREKEEV